ncbi:MAG: hypothetical protein M1820_001010 [Bogoriella megaspora]|nr:MAG: hypothetical protein M1820_001010 [Bogoriella megaspora]
MADEYAIARIQAANIDGRTENARYRQNELQALHKVLRENADAICDAIQKDAQGPKVEVDAEYYMGMLAVRDAYKSLDFDQELKEEYQIARGKDNAERRIKYGIVLIRPTTHTRFFSIVSPLALALATGNCVLLELPQTLSHLDQILRDCLTKVLDQDTFVIASDEVKDHELIGGCLLVDQTGLVRIDTPRTLTSRPDVQTIAVVDRSADIQQAAKTIVAARFAYGGSSPYSPDIVLINEFKKREFFEACVHYASQYIHAQIPSKRTSSDLVGRTRDQFKDAEIAGTVQIWGSRDYMIADISNRDCPLLDIKISGCHLAIAPCSSLMDVIALIQTKQVCQSPTRTVASNRTRTPFLASYLFSDPPTAKFLSQYINSHVSFVNQIPLTLLTYPVGPATPSGHVLSPRTRYTTAMFTQSRPQYAQSLPVDVQLAASSLDVGIKSSSDQNKAKLKALKPEQLRKLATVALPPTGQGKGFSIGFFEQGILIGLGGAAAVVLPVIGYATWFAGSRAWRALRK